MGISLDCTHRVDQDENAQEAMETQKRTMEEAADKLKVEIQNLELNVQKVCGHSLSQ